MNYAVSKIQVQFTKIEGGMANLAFEHYFVGPARRKSAACVAMAETQESNAAITFALQPAVGHPSIPRNQAIPDTDAVLAATQQ